MKDLLKVFKAMLLLMEYNVYDEVQMRLNHWKHEIEATLEETGVEYDLHYADRCFFVDIPGGYRIEMPLRPYGDGYFTLDDVNVKGVNR